MKKHILSAPYTTLRRSCNTIKKKKSSQEHN
jgi:hypothetical protein